MPEIPSKLRFDPCRLVRQVKSFGELEVRATRSRRFDPCRLAGR
jgi:hypothetical protein